MVYKNLREFVVLSDTSTQFRDTTLYNPFLKHFKGLQKPMNRLLSLATSSLDGTDTTFSYKKIDTTGRIPPSTNYGGYKYFYTNGATCVTGSDSYIMSKESEDEAGKIFHGLNDDLSEKNADSKDSLYILLRKKLKIATSADGKTNTLIDEKFKPILIYALKIDAVKKDFAYLYRYPSYYFDGNDKLYSYTHYNYSTRDYFLAITNDKTIFLDTTKNFGITPIYSDYKRNLPVRTVWIRNKSRTHYVFVDFTVSN